VYRLRTQSSLSRNGMCDVSECKVIVSEHIVLCLGTYFTLSQNGNFVVLEHEIIVSTREIMHRLGPVISSSRNGISSSTNTTCNGHLPKTGTSQSNSWEPNIGGDFSNSQEPVSRSDSRLYVALPALDQGSRPSLYEQ